MNIIAVIGILLFCLYVVITTQFFFIPESLSASFYHWVDAGLKWPFKVALITSSICLMIPMIALGNDNILQFTGFLSPVSLMFTGAAADFKNKDSIDKWLHPLSAVICACSSLMWEIFVIKIIIYLITAFLVCGILSIVTKTLLKCYTFWLEMACFLSIFCCLIKIYYF